MTGSKLNIFIILPIIFLLTRALWIGNREIDVLQKKRLRAREAGEAPWRGKS
jgi:hypothetical protein